MAECPHLLLKHSAYLLLSGRVCAAAANNYGVGQRSGDGASVNTVSKAVFQAGGERHHKVTSDVFHLTLSLILKTAKVNIQH